MHFIRRSIFLLLHFFVLLSVAPSKASAQLGAGMVTITADSEIHIETGGVMMQQLIGHVRFAQGTMTGSSDRAVFYMEQNRIELTGNVHILQDTLSLEAPHVTWEANEHTGHADGNVTLVDRDVTLRAVTGDYDAQNQIALFHNNVRITQGRTLMKSDELTYYRATETSVARGHVYLSSDSGRMHADNVTYSRALDEMTADGNVDLRNDSMTITSDWLFNAKPQGILFARGKVVVHSLTDNTVIFGDTLARFAKLAYVTVPRNPFVFLIDTSTVRDSLTGKQMLTYDTLFLKSRLMEAYQGDSTRFIATDSVRIFRSGFSAIGGKLFYNEKANLMTLSNGPRQRLWYDSTEIVGDSVAMFLQNKKIHELRAIGHAFSSDPVAELPGSGRVNQLQAEEIHANIDHDTIKNVLAVSNALSIYFVLSEGKANGLNRVSGDSIRIDFVRKTVRKVTVLFGTEGEYFPERYVRFRGKDFRLSGYDRRLALRPSREDFIKAPILLPIKSNGEIPKPTPTSPRKKFKK